VILYDVWADPLLRGVAGGILGLILGSFLGALVVRWPAGLSIARGRSRCDSCNATLTPRDLVPLVSAIVLHLRCRRCGVGIDPVHITMESGAGIIGVVACAGTVGPLAALGWCVLGWTLLALAVLDWRHFWLPDALTLPLAFAGFIIGPYATGVAMADAGIGAACGYGALLAIALGYRALRGREGLGLGDAKLLGAIGAWTGWQALPLLLLCASASGLIWVGMSGLSGRRLRADMRVPLGTFLCLAVGPAIMLRNIMIGGIQP
jgi:leader peptidase (prepilin peptidase)/N-methyltransferase